MVNVLYSYSNSTTRSTNSPVRKIVNLGSVHYHIVGAVVFLVQLLGEGFHPPRLLHPSRIAEWSPHKRWSTHKFIESGRRCREDLVVAKCSSSGTDV